MNARVPARVLLAATIAWSLAARAGAQTPPIQLGVDFSGLGLYRTPIQTGVYGVGARVDLMLTKRVDDGRLTWFPAASRAGTARHQQHSNHHRRRLAFLTNRYSPYCSIP